MRDNVRAFVEVAARAFHLAGPVYEFGSYLVENQQGRGDLRSVFAGQRYTGCDMRPGPGVDRVEDLAQLKLPNDSAATIICVDTLEHVFELRKAMDEMLRVLAPGGVILIAVPLDFHVHDYPGDYWRLTPSCLSRLLSPLAGTIVGWQGVADYPHTVFGIGCKAPLGERFSAGAARFIDGFQLWLELAALNVPWQRKLKRWTLGLLRSKGERRRERDFHHAQFAVHLPIGQDWKHHLFTDPTAADNLGSRIDLQ